MALSTFCRDRLLSKPFFFLLVAAAPLFAESILPRTGSVAGFLGIEVAQPSEGAGTCTRLENMGGYSNVVLQVGEPSQQLSVVADTGSSSVIVASCYCQNCNANECYDNTKSSSAVKNTEPREVKMSFGSGDITSNIITDVVKIGAASALMTDGVLEMVYGELDGDFEFEGILGLGLPIDENLSDGIQYKSFLAEAGISHFSICLNADLSAGGVLRLAGPDDGAAAKLGNRGASHWALGLNGISVGDGASSSSRLQFCSPVDMKSGQATPCGAIPDSGTTLILGPKDQVLELFGGICDGWPRCAAAQQSSRESKAEIFSGLLTKCHEWIHEAGLDELPTLHFHITGADNAEFPLALSPQSYIIEMQRNLYESNFQSLVGTEAKGPVNEGPIPDSLAGEVCAPAFGEVDMDTEGNGPVWLLGTSFFYEYIVHYNLQPQAISFEQGSCGECLSDGTDRPYPELFMTEGGANGTSGRQALRRLSTAPRQPHRFDTRHGKL